MKWFPFVERFQLRSETGLIDPEYHRAAASNETAGVSKDHQRLLKALGEKWTELYSVMSQPGRAWGLWTIPASRKQTDIPCFPMEERKTTYTVFTPKKLNLNLIEPLDVWIYRKYKRQRRLLNNISGMQLARSRLWKNLQEKMTNTFQGKERKWAWLKQRRNPRLRRDIQTEWNAWPLFGFNLNKLVVKKKKNSRAARKAFSTKGKDRITNPTHCLWHFLA